MVVFWNLKPSVGGSCHQTFEGILQFWRKCVQVDAAMKLVTTWPDGIGGLQRKRSYRTTFSSETSLITHTIKRCQNSQYYSLSRSHLESPHTDMRGILTYVVGRSEENKDSQNLAGPFRDFSFKDSQNSNKFVFTYVSTHCNGLEIIFLGLYFAAVLWYL